MKRLKKKLLFSTIILSSLYGCGGVSSSNDGASFFTSSSSDSTSEQIITEGFTGQFEESTWSQSTTSNMNINFDSTNSIFTLASAGGTNRTGKASISNKAPEDGYIRFNYVWSAAQGSDTLPASVAINGVVTNLTNTNITNTQKGILTLPIKKGQTLSFDLGTTSRERARIKSNQLKISNFLFIPNPDDKVWGNGFTDQYALVTWSKQASNGYSVKPTGNYSIQFQNMAQGVSPTSNKPGIEITREIQSNGAVTFDYNYLIYQYAGMTAGYILNGKKVPFDISNITGRTLSGQVRVGVQAGDKLGFYMTPLNVPNGAGQAYMTIANFAVIPTPYPGTVNFTGDFAANTWQQIATRSKSGSSAGQVDMSKAPNQITLSSGNTFLPGGSQSAILNTAPEDGAIIVDYTFNNPGNDGPLCVASFTVNDAVHIFSPRVYGVNESHKTKGKLVFQVNKGDQFGFHLGKGGNKGYCYVTNGVTSTTLELNNFTFSTENIPGTTNFTGNFAQNNWSQIGTVNFNNTTNTVNLQSSKKNKANLSSIKNFALNDGAVTFKYNYASSNPISCPASVKINDNYFPLSNAETGYRSFQLNKGDSFEIVLGDGNGIHQCTNKGRGKSTLAISDFAFTYSEVPKPLENFTGHFAAANWKYGASVSNLNPQSFYFDTSNAPNSLKLRNDTSWKKSAVSISNSFPQAGIVAFAIDYEYNNSSNNCPAYYRINDGQSFELIPQNTTAPVKGMRTIPVDAGDKLEITLGWCLGGNNYQGSLELSQFRYITR